NPLPGATNATFTLSRVQPSDAGDYTVLITNSVGSALSTPASLTVRLLPAITQQPVSLTVTQGQDTSFTVVAASNAPLTIHWCKNGKNLGDAVNSTLPLTNTQPPNSGTLDVIVANTYGAVTSSVVVLVVFGLDFGDAPEPAYPTLLARDGARHVVVPGVFLGSN